MFLQWDLFTKNQFYDKPDLSLKKDSVCTNSYLTSAFYVTHREKTQSVEGDSMLGHQCPSLVPTATKLSLNKLRTTPDSIYLDFSIARVEVLYWSVKVNSALLWLKKIPPEKIWEKKSLTPEKNFKNQDLHVFFFKITYCHRSWLIALGIKISLVEFFTKSVEKYSRKHQLYFTRYCF